MSDQRCWCGEKHPITKHNIENCRFCSIKVGLVGIDDGEVCPHNPKNAIADEKEHNDFINGFSCRK